MTRCSVAEPSGRNASAPEVLAVFVEAVGLVGSYLPSTNAASLSIGIVHRQLVYQRATTREGLMHAG